MHPCSGNCLVIGRAVESYARAAQAHSAGIKCRHCSGSFCLEASGESNGLDVIALLSLSLQFKASFIT